MTSRSLNKCGGADIFLDSVILQNQYYVYKLRYSLPRETTLSSALVVLRDVLYQSEVTSGTVYEDVTRLVIDMQAGALLVVSPVLIIYLIFQRLFVESIERTGVVE
ncbi:MAG: hypothetical protein PHV88_00440 [Eubacteriales bacterium]|nr:hypothetical protein [Eubacteriales bacterium]